LLLAGAVLIATAANADGTPAPVGATQVGGPTAAHGHDQTACCCAGAGGTTADVPAPQVLDATSARVRSIDIEIDNVFDTSLPEESAWLYRSGNRLHLLTQEDTIRSQLLFREQEPFSLQKVQETERLLRNQRYLYDAWIVPTCYDQSDGSVDLQVRVRDVWSLNPGFAFGRKGGANHGGVALEDENFLGRGEKLALSYGKDVDRSSLALSYQDPQLFGSWWRGNLALADSSDGGLASIELSRPFYSLDTRWSAGFSALTNERVESRYGQGHELDSYAVDEDRVEIQGGVSHGLQNGWSRRWLTGIRYEESQFAARPDVPPIAPLPADRRLLTPWLGVSFVQDGYTTERNLDQIARTEDVQFGRELRGELGIASSGMGSDRDAVLLALSAATGDRIADSGSLFVGGSFSGRLESAGLRDGLLTAEARYYWRERPDAVFFAATRGAAAFNPDLDHPIELGGENGLRGYPLRFQVGTGSVLLTAEQRLYTDWYPFRLFRVGAAAFADAGRTWGEDAAGNASLGWLADAGFGLRLGNERSGLGNVIHIDLAFPLVQSGGVDSVQLLVETRQRF
jgi:outer membrane protein assembly factor BamA